jgi:hypothetical protein
MDDPLAKFDKDYLLTDEEKRELAANFKPVLTDAFGKDLLVGKFAAYKNARGIYFFVLSHAGKQYKIYIGKTSSLANRLLDYLREFEPYSPNDYKLRIFAAFLAELAPEATLDLYFAKKTSDDRALTDAENKAVKKYRPLLNNLRPSAEAREKLKDAFVSFYRSAL